MLTGLGWFLFGSVIGAISGALVNDYYGWERGNAYMKRISDLQEEIEELQEELQLRDAADE